MILLALILAAAGVPRQDPIDATIAAIFAAEQARAAEPRHLEVLVAASGHVDTLVQRLAVRALGRLEREELLPRIVPLLGAAAVSVRVEAANAIAQAAYRVDGAPAMELLMARLATEEAAPARGALLAAIGRLRVVSGSSPHRSALALMTAELEHDGEHIEGALRGAWDLLRRQGRTGSADARLTAALRHRLATGASPGQRRLALMALSAGNAVDSAAVALGFGDADPQVRRLAVLAARTGPGTPGRNRVFAAGLRDPEIMVRIEAVRGWAAHGRTTEGCEPLIAAVRDPAITVQLLAIESLGAGCGVMAAPRELLEAITREPIGPANWHRPVRALAALAATDSARAQLRLASFVTHSVWWVRMHVAAVAQRLGDRAALGLLLDDPVDNVREAALRALITLDGRAADRQALAQLGRPDFQLVLTAARALRGSAVGPDVATTALATFERLSRPQAETTRDPRLVLLDRVAEFGSPELAGRLRPALRDIDPAVATRAAEILTAWTGSPVAPEPRPTAAPSLPPVAELRMLTSATLVLEDGSRLTLALRPLEAPGSVARFVAMARSGWFDGLTLHRVVPNFVLQGGSPGANEYHGGAAFSRDEVGAAHRRGTVGISTRGRDTGDGQLFINLVDNLNLDHEYTVIGEIVGEVAPIDHVREGAVIRRVELVLPFPRPEQEGR